MVLQQNLAHVNSKVKQATLTLSRNNGNGEAENTQQKARQTISFAHKQSPDTHVDAMNINQHFITPSAGHQIDLRKAPKFCRF